MRTFPESAMLKVGPPLAASLSEAATRLPFDDDGSVGIAEAQTCLREQLQSHCPDGFHWLVEEIGLRLARAPFCALVRGISFDSRGTLFVAITSSFGDLVETYGRAAFAPIRRISPATDRREYGHGTLNEQLHTDSTDWPSPNNYTCLLCVRPDQNGGGQTRLLDRDELLQQLVARHGPSVLETLRRDPAPWRLADELGGGVTWHPILSEQGVRYMRYTIDSAAETNAARLSPELSSALEAMEQTTRAPEGVMGLALEADDLLLVNNKLCLHARTEVPFPERSSRLVLRVKVARGEEMSGRLGGET